jgi:hypothetical protein
MSRLVNKFPGRCKCGTYVQQSAGFVCDRKITCINCVSMLLNPTPFSIMYQGCDYEESMSEYMYDHYENESDYVGFDVGDQ